MAKGIDRSTLFEPLPYLLRPCVKKRIVDFHTRVSNIAEEDKIRCYSDLQREIRFALKRMQYLVFFSRANADWSGIHHDPCNVVLAKQGIQIGCKRLFIKIRMTYFDGKAQFQYAMRVQVPGQFRVAPARVERMYEPDVRANSASAGLTILDK